MALHPLTPERRRQLTRDALIDAAAEAFARRGIHAASLDEIASAAGFTKGAIYSNFGGKEELLLAVVEERGERMLAAMWHAHEVSTAHRLHDAHAAAEMWRRVVAGDEQMMLLRLELRLYALRDPRFRSKLAELQARQHEQAASFLLREAAATGFTFALPAADIAGVLIAMTEGLLQQAAVDSERRPVYEQLFERFLELLVSAGTRDVTSD